MTKQLRPNVCKNKTPTDRQASKDKEDREKSARESLGKFFYDIAKATFIAMVLGNTATIFGLTEYSVDPILAVGMGFVGTTTFAYMGNKTLKN